MKNAPGFVVNRILVPMINEAFFVLAEGLATAEDIDAGMKLGCNHPIGPLALADMIGLDTCLAVMNVYFAEFNDSKYRPCPLLKEMVAAGYLGRKTGRGVYAVLMTLTELKYIVAVARERHFGWRAEACFVSQPTLSAWPSRSSRKTRASRPLSAAPAR